MDLLRATPWLPPQGPPLPPYQRGVATYPQVYYWSVHALSEPIIRGAGLNPWDATFVYRLATCALVAVLWALVWVACRRAGIPGDVAGTLLAFVLLTPMLAFISSAINPDAVNDALCALVIVAAWEVLTRGTGATVCAIALLAAALTKPAGLQLAAVLALVAIGLGAVRLVDRRRAAARRGHRRRGSPAPRSRCSTPGSRCASWPRARRTTRSGSTSSSAGSCSPTCGARTGASSDGSTTTPRRLVRG